MNFCFPWIHRCIWSFSCSVDVTVKEGELVAVVGQVGAGKSSLVSAILGEMKCLQGQVTLKVT